MRKLFVTFLLCAACSGGAHDTMSPDALGPFDRRVDAADVSILYPLTSGTSRDDLIRADEMATYGQLLPELVVAGNPYPLDTQGGFYADMRLISLRIDPCSARGGCSPEIRAVYQPILTTAGGTVAADGAIHVFYAMPADELVVVVEQILALKKAHGAGVAYPVELGPQPVLVATGLSGEYARGLHEVWLSHLGAQRIARVTFMLHIFPDEDAWELVRFDRQGDALVPVAISHTQDAKQLLFGASALVAEITTAFAQAIDAQDPRTHDSESIDCGSCHLAEGARRVGTDAYGLTVTGGFTSSRSLAYRRDTIAVTNFHAFGYLGTAVSVAQRTANESAVVADRVQSALPAGAM
jgi:hypothetical protein